MVKRVVLNALEVRLRRRILLCARKGKRILAPFGDGYRLEDKTIHLDQR